MGVPKTPSKKRPLDTQVELGNTDTKIASVETEMDEDKAKEKKLEADKQEYLAAWKNSTDPQEKEVYRDLLRSTNERLTELDRQRKKDKGSRSTLLETRKDLISERRHRRKKRNDSDSEGYSSIGSGLDINLKHFNCLWEERKDMVASADMFT